MAVVYVVLHALALLVMLLAGELRAPGRRGGPTPVGEPTDQDRETVAKLHADARADRERELEAQAAAAEPAGEPPGDAQRQEILTIERRSAERRAAAARALRRQPVAVGDIYDDERDQVRALHEQSADERYRIMEDRGIDDPNADEGTAGFPPELPNLPGSELFGVFTCGTCGAQVERHFPGYVDWDAASRDLVCPQCGARVLRGSAPPAAEPSASGADGVQTSAQAATSSTSTSSGEALPTGASAAPTVAPLSDAERAEYEQLRAEKAAREAGETRRAGDWREPPAAEPSAAEPTAETAPPPETTEQQPPAG